MSKLSGLINFLFGKDGRVVATQGDSLPQPAPRPEDLQPGKHLTVEAPLVTTPEAAQALVRRATQVSGSASPFTASGAASPRRKFSDIAVRRPTEPILVDPTDMAAITASMR